MVQKLGKAEERDDRAEITRIRFMLEKNYVLTPCRYDLLAVTYDPVKRWKTGLMQEETVTTYQAPKKYWIKGGRASTGFFLLEIRRIG